MIIAIDGPAGSGKGTITKIIGKKLNFINIDTGAMYRCVTLECLRQGVKITDLQKIEQVLENIEISFKKENDIQKTFLNNKDVTNEIRTAEIDNNVAKYSALKIIRDKMTPMQRSMGENSNIIMEGRDIGTVVFPNADVKIFLDCSVEERARRRYNQDLKQGMEISYEAVLESIKERHKLETERDVAPFVKAEDAIYIDTTEMTIDEVVNKIIDIIKSKSQTNI